MSKLEEIVDHQAIEQLASQPLVDRRKAEEWKQSFVEESRDAAEVAAAFLAERYSDPAQDIVTLVYSRERDCFTAEGPHVISDVWLNEEIEEFIKANRGMGWIVSSWRVLHVMKGLCHWWAEIEAPETTFPS